MGDSASPMVTDAVYMARAVELAASVRCSTSPNPWVGAVVVGAGGEIGCGATETPPGSHAEVVALESAGERARGSTLFVTLEPCAHRGRTDPCVEAIVRAEVSRVVIGVRDPDENVSGRGIALLRKAGIDVEVGIGEAAVVEQLAPYLKQRTTGRPWVVLKLAATIDGRIAAPDGSSQWITGPQARHDVHVLRAMSDAILVGAGTIRIDDPSLTVRPDPEDRSPSDASRVRQPLRVVLGSIGPTARVGPALEMSGELGSVLDELGGRGVLQVLVEGGATVAHQFHSAGLVDRYVIYLAPSLSGGDDALGMFRGPGGPTLADFWRGRFVSVRELGDDIRVDLEG